MPHRLNPGLSWGHGRIDPRPVEYRFSQARESHQSHLTQLSPIFLEWTFCYYFKQFRLVHEKENKQRVHGIIR